MKHLSWVIAFLSCSLLMASETVAPLPDRNARYRIQPLDTVQINFEFTPEFNIEPKVQPDGFVTVKGAGDVKLAGLTIVEAEQAIAAKYQGILRAPVINVSLKEFTLPAVTVGGYVVKPGRIDLRGRLSVSDAIAIAGGFGPGAKDSEVLLFRRAAGDLVEVKKINVRQMLKAGKLAEDVPLRDGDALYVARSALASVERFMAVSHLGMYFNPLPFLK